MFIIWCMPHRIFNPHPQHTLIVTLFPQIFTDCLPHAWLDSVGENGSLKGKERRKNCLCLWERREDEGWWDVSSLTPLKFSGKSWIITGCCWEARQGADTSSVGTGNAGWGVGRNGGRGHLSLSHVRALDSAPGLSSAHIWAPQMWSSRLMRVKKKWCWGSRFSEVERWRWTGGMDLCAPQVWWRNGRSPRGRAGWEFFLEVREM